MAEKLKKKSEEKFETIAYVLVKDSKGLVLQKAKFTEQPYEVLEEVDLKNSFSESVYFIKKYFVDLLRKMF